MVQWETERLTSGVMSLKRQEGMSSSTQLEGVASHRGPGDPRAVMGVG